MNEIIKNRIYKHFKGDSYIVVDIATDCDTLEKKVIYRGLYGEGPLWVRSYDDFMGEVDHKKYPEIKQKYKFELQDVKSKRK